jgi:mannose-6-phosphate isomerase-like protein (cupin superfamily)
MLRRGEVHQNRLVADLYIGPGRRLVAEHCHPSIRERFTVIRGRVGFSLGGRRAIAEPGASMEVPPGLAHDWWNAGDDEAHVLVEIAPAAHFETAIRNSFGLDQDGEAYAREFDDVVRLTPPPRTVQMLLFSMLGLIARLFGYRGSYPEYLTRRASAVVDVMTSGEDEAKSPIQ